MNDPAPPPVSRRSQPRFRSRDRRDQLAQAFLGQGTDYDRLRPGYPPAALDAILRALQGYGITPDAEPRTDGTEPRADDVRTAVDLGAGTGKLSLALAARGVEVIAVDPSRAMLDVAAASASAPTSTLDVPRRGEASTGDGTRPSDGDRQRPPRHTTGPDRTDAMAREGRTVASARGSLRTVVGTAEATGLPDACADLVTAAQAWHWFDTEAASAEAARLLRPGGTLALIWNTMDVQIPWVHRYSRIMHAGDVQKDDFAPPIAAGFVPIGREVIRWEDPMPTGDLIELARTRSYVITANEATRAKVLANLDWYLHEHLGHAPGEVVGLPYRTDVFWFRQG